MKIDSSNRTSSLTGETAVTPRNAKAPAQSGRSAAQDSVTLSSASSQMQTLAAGVSADSGFDLAKVEAIKQAISEGRFTINPEAIADKLIASTRELLAQQNA